LAEPEPEAQPVRHDRGAHAAALAELAEPVVPSPTVRAAVPAPAPVVAEPVAVATPTVVPAAATPAADLDEAEEDAGDAVDAETSVASPRIVAPRSPADLVPPATPPTVLNGVRVDEEPGERVGAPSVIWAPNGAKQSWS
jgi:hypothetical protein